jgi:hypothetical protein
MGSSLRKGTTMPLPYRAASSKLILDRGDKHFRSESFSLVAKGAKENESNPNSQ